MRTLARTDIEAAPARALAKAIERLKAIIEAETALLIQGGKIDFETLNARKTHGLMELIQASKATDAHDALETLEGVERLRELLVANEEILERHLQATQEIAMLMAESIRNDESDGTYSARRPGVR